MLEVVAHPNGKDPPATGIPGGFGKSPAFLRDRGRIFLVVVFGKQLELVVVLVIDTQVQDILAIALHIGQHGLEGVLSEGIAGIKVDGPVAIGTIAGTDTTVMELVLGPDVELSHGVHERSAKDARIMGPAEIVHAHGQGGIARTKAAGKLQAIVTIGAIVLAPPGGKGESGERRAGVGKRAVTAKHRIGRETTVVSAEHVHRVGNGIVVGHPHLAVAQAAEVAAQADLGDADILLLVPWVLHGAIGQVQGQLQLSKGFRAAGQRIVGIEADAGIGVAKTAVAAECGAVIGSHRFRLYSQRGIEGDVGRLGVDDYRYGDGRDDGNPDFLVQHEHPPCEKGLTGASLDTRLREGGACC